MKDDARDSPTQSPITFLPPAEGCCAKCGQQFVRAWNMLQPLELHYLPDEARAEFFCHCGMPVVGWRPAAVRDISEAVQQLLELNCPVEVVWFSGRREKRVFLTPFPESGCMMECPDSIN